MDDCRDDARVGSENDFSEELMDPSTWYLVDTKEPQLVMAKTILTSSPNRELYKVSSCDDT